MGDLKQAESIFEGIAERDALEFSPLLGTKLRAAFRWGILAFARGDRDKARSAWPRAVDETRRLLREGDWQEILVDSDRPETFGLPEVAAFVMEAARAAAGLRALQDYPDKPSLVWEALHSTLADVVQSQDLEFRLFRRWAAKHDADRDAWIEDLLQAKGWLSRQLLSWTATASEKDEQLQSLAGELTQLGRDKAWIEQQWSAWQAAAGEKDEQLQSLTGQLTQLSGDKAWIEQQWSAWQAAASEKESLVQSQQSRLNQLNEVKTSFENQLAATQVQVDEQADRLYELVGEIGKMRDTNETPGVVNSRLLLQEQQSEQCLLARQREIHAIAKNCVEDGRRLRAIESSRLVRFGRKLGLLRIRE